MVLAKRILSANDHERLVPAVARARGSWLTYAPYLDLFGAELRRSRTVLPAEVPPDVVTMNSRFALHVRGEEGPVCYTLVYPGEEAPSQGKVSVLSPMGTALLGARVGQEVCWLSPEGPEVATVRRLVYQPESAGDER
jgi:regulator of nucleoside diphosphate kinase